MIEIEWIPRKCLPSRQQDKCRERHVQAAINAPQVSNSVNWSNVTAEKLNFILNKAKLPTTTVKPNQFPFSLG